MQGATLKSIGKDKFEALIEKEGADGGLMNREKWESNKFTAPQKRVRISLIVGEAWEEPCSKNFQNHRRSGFEKAGCAVSASGKNDHLIQVDNHGFVWPPAPGLGTCKRILASTFQICV